MIARARPLKGVFFRSVEFRFMDPDEVLSGAGAERDGGRFVPVGTKAIYLSKEDATASNEVTAANRAWAQHHRLLLSDIQELYSGWKSKSRLTSISRGGHGAKRLRTSRRSAWTPMILEPLRRLADSFSLPVSRESYSPRFWGRARTEFATGSNAVRKTFQFRIGRNSSTKLERSLVTRSDRPRLERKMGDYGRFQQTEFV